MTRLKAPKSLANTELSVRNADGTFSRIKVDEHGELWQVEGTTVTLDGDGNKLRVVTVEGVAGQPDQHFFAFDDGDIPPELNEFVTELDIGAGETVVPARYVRGVHSEKRDVPLSEELQDVLRADTSLGVLLQEVNDPEDEPEADYDEEAADAAGEEE